MSSMECPVCGKTFESSLIQNHVNKCIFLNLEDGEEKSPKRTVNQRGDSESAPKKMKLDTLNSPPTPKVIPSNSSASSSSLKKPDIKSPLAEILRPVSFEEYVGQEHVLGEDKMLRLLMNQNEIPSLILWGPPGCGKTSLAHVINKTCIASGQNFRFVKLSATMAGINDVKEVAKVAKNEWTNFKRKTILFMDEIHRFNKLQQDIFLPHVENGTITLIGATTENPSFSLNSALLSRCRVIVLEKLSTNVLMTLLRKGINRLGIEMITNPSHQTIGRSQIEESTLEWLAEMSDGDARIALNSLQIVHQSKPASFLSLEDVKNGVKKSHLLYDKKGDEHYTIISALHKSIRASDDNASLYWLARMLEGGEDPMYVARRLVRAASEDIGLADSNALVLAVSALHGCEKIGMPECNVLLAQVAVYLARAPKSREIDDAYSNAKKSIVSCKGALPPVPLALRNRVSKLTRDLNWGKGYNMKHKDESGLEYMPEGMEGINFFSEPGNDSDSS
nr:PREDICTED: ATPase WRNIP1-like [Bemisia tabaci]